MVSSCVRGKILPSMWIGSRWDRRQGGQSQDFKKMMEASIRVMAWGWGEVGSLEKEIGSTGPGEQQVREIREQGSKSPGWGYPSLSRKHRREEG